MKSFILSLDLDYDKTINPRQAMPQAYNSYMARLEKDGFFEGITIHSRQEHIWTACISGNDDKIKKLKDHLEETKKGLIAPNSKVYMIQ